MDIDYYKAVEDELEEAKAIYDGLKEMHEGKVKSGKLVMQNMKEKYGL